MYMILNTRESSYILVRNTIKRDIYIYKILQHEVCRVYNDTKIKYRTLLIYDIKMTIE